jgi:hypothetical protein
MKPLSAAIAPAEKLETTAMDNTEPVVGRICFIVFLLFLLIDRLKCFSRSAVATGV